MQRRVVSYEAIAGLIRAQMTLIPDCRTCTCGPVTWRKPDEDGCNWILSGIEGATCLGCLDELVPLIVNLRGNFNVPEPRLQLDRARRPPSTGRVEAATTSTDERASRRIDDLLVHADQAMRESRSWLRLSKRAKASADRQCAASHRAIDSTLALLLREGWRWPGGSDGRSLVDGSGATTDNR